MLTHAFSDYLKLQDGIRQRGVVDGQLVKGTAQAVLGAVGKAAHGLSTCAGDVRQCGRDTAHGLRNAAKWTRGAAVSAVQGTGHCLGGADGVRA